MLKQLTLFMLLVSVLTYGQYDWSKHNFKKENKRSEKISGSSIKALKKFPTFINRYEIVQATQMSGGTKGASKAVYSKVGLSGVQEQAFQQAVNELHGEFVEGLKSLEIPISNGEDILARKTAQKYQKKGKDYYKLGNIGNNTKEVIEGKLIDGGYIRFFPAAGGTTDAISFSPQNKNVYYCDHVLKSGLFYQNMVYKEKVNLMTARYYVTFASFNGSKGYKNVTLSTNAVMCVGVQFQVQTAKGKPIFIMYERPVFADANWSKGLVKTKDNSSNLNEAFGWGGAGARSAAFVVKADSEAYIQSLKAIIGAIQNNIIAVLKAEM